jgi:hypothetical protein
MSLRVNHPDLTDGIKTYLASLVASTATSMEVQDSSGFAADDFAIVGIPGAERTEIKKISAITDADTIGIAALAFSHPSNTPVIKTPYDKVSVYSSETESGTFTEITGSPFAIQIDQPFTVIEDPDFTSTTWYKISFYNSDSEAESSLSDAIQGSGPRRGSVRSLIQRVRKYVGLKDENVITDEDIIGMFNECIDEVQGLKGYPKSEYYYEEDSDHEVSDYLKPDNCVELKSIRLERSGSYTYPVYLPWDQFKEYSLTSSEITAIPQYYTIWANRVIFAPNFSDDDTKIKWYFIATIPHIDSDNDLPAIDKPEILVYYACSMISVMRKNKDDIDYWLNRYEARKKTFLGVSGSKQSTKFNKVRRPGTARFDDPQRSVQISVPA